MGWKHQRGSLDPAEPHPEAQVTLEDCATKASAMITGGGYNSGDIGSDVRDALSDLMHLCDKLGLDFEELVTKASDDAAWLRTSNDHERRETMSTKTEQEFTFHSMMRIEIPIEVKVKAASLKAARAKANEEIDDMDPTDYLFNNILNEQGERLEMADEDAEEFALGGDAVVSFDIAVADEKHNEE